MDDSKIYIEWEKKFEIGIPMIDKQHKILVEMCNDLYQGLLSHKQNSKTAIDEPLRKTLHAAVAYVKEHFSAEEKLMVKCGYPKFAEHKKRHEKFVAKILETAKQIEESPVLQSFQFIKFIYEWILEHIAHEDKLYVHYVLEYVRKAQQEKTVA